MRTYRAYDQRIRSEIPLPELADASGDHDVRIRSGEVPASASALSPEYDAVYEAPDGSHSVSATPASVHWSYDGIATMLVEEGTDIVIDGEDAVPDERVRQILLGPGLRTVLVQQGHLVIHASAVAVDGRAIAFLGSSGSGKSTLAAACYARGHSVICDDVTAVGTNAGDPTLLPGFPRVKLHPEPAAAFGLAPGTTETTSTPLERRYYDVSERFLTNSLPLARIYVVERGADVRIEPIEGRSVPTTLLDPLYRLYAETEVEALETHFRRCANVARRVGVKRLVGPDSLAELPDLVRTIEHDLG